MINNHIQQLLSRQIPEDILQGEFKLVEMVAEVCIPFNLFMKIEVDFMRL